MSLIELIVIRDALAGEAQTLDGDCLFDLVRSVYPQGLPLGTYLYHERWDSDCDVTPSCAADIDALNDLGGTFYLVTYPTAAVPLWAVLAISVGVSLAVAFLMPLPKIPKMGNSQPPSPNNDLAQRANQQRLGGRVPDIYGEVWAVPDLLAPSYSAYIEHDETEFSYMLIGRGNYKITEAKDDTTPINQINSAAVDAYKPYVSVFQQSYAHFGAGYNKREHALSRLTAKRYTSVNGQVLSPPDNYLSFAQLTAKSDGSIAAKDVDLTNYFKAGDKININDAGELASANGLLDSAGKPIKYNINGSYTISEVSGNSIVLDNPAASNSAWKLLADNTDYSVAEEFTISTSSGALWQGWFYTDNSDFSDIMLNVVAPNGLYVLAKEGDKWSPISVDFEVEVEVIKGAEVFYSNKVAYSLTSRKAEFYIGSATKDDDVRRSAGNTYYIPVPPRPDSSYQTRFRIRRVTNTLRPGKQQVMQEIRIKDFYSVRYFTGFEQSSAATTVYSKQKATDAALALKERKLKLLVQRYVRDWRNNDALILSNRIDDIIYDIATDPDIGGLTIADLNMARISAEVSAQIEYFGTDLCAQFCGTFDNTDVTVEEMIQTVAQAGFFQAYRINNQIHLHFERPTDYPVVQFNAHNMLPDTYDMSESFGARNDYDGVQVTYTDPIDDARVTLDYPPDKSAINPQKVELIGVRNKIQAHMHMMRAHWKNQLAYKSCELTGADESGIVIPTNRIDVADIYHAGVQQGVVERLDAVNGQTILTLSEPVKLSGQATVFVQTMGGLVDNIRCTRGGSDYELVLSRAPIQPLSTAWDAVVRATYRVVTHDDYDRDSYIVTKKDVAGALSHKLTCINYDDRYYQNDSDFKRGLINV